jgi:hypothetical protein
VLALLAAPRGRVLEVLRSWRVILTLAVLAVGVAAAGVWILSTNTLSSMGVFPGADLVTPVGAFLVMLLDRTFDPGVIGVFGWLDTFAPGFVLVLWSALLLGLLVAALTVLRGRALLALVAAAAVVVLVPPTVQAASIETSGYIWQGRYTLVAFVCLMLLAGLLLGQRLQSPWFARRLLVSVSVLVVVAHGYSLAFATKRYAVGLDSSWTQFVVGPRWMPPGGAVWILTCLLGAIALVALMIATHGRRPAAVTADTDSSESGADAGGTADDTAAATRDAASATGSAARPSAVPYVAPHRDGVDLGAPSRPQGR